jgi:hypothetical protein
MIDRRSRYASTPLVPDDGPDGSGQALLDLRISAAAPGVLQIVPTSSDRLDTLAWQYYKDPTRFWRICDAATETDPFDVVVPGNPIAVPPDK